MRYFREGSRIAKNRIRENEKYFDGVNIDQILGKEGHEEGNFTHQEGKHSPFSLQGFQGCRGQTGVAFAFSSLSERLRFPPRFSLTRELSRARWQMGNRAGAS
jgi:hypothetical protein